MGWNCLWGGGKEEINYLGGENGEMEWKYFKNAEL